MLVELSAKSTVCGNDENGSLAGDERQPPPMFGITNRGGDIESCGYRLESPLAFK
jgi:hypothetical protein